MKTRLFASLLLTLGFAAASFAQPAPPAYPNKPIRFVVAFAAGSATDAAARYVGQQITQMTGQPVIVDNKPGASGFIAVDAVVKAAADGYTVFLTTQTTQAANPSLFKRLPYDPVRDLTPVAPISRAPLLLIAAPKFAADNLAQLTALAKARPGKLTFGAGNSSARAGGELFKMLAGVDLLHVPYKSNPQAITDLIGGQIDLVWADVFTGMTQVRAGNAKALATTGKRRIEAAKDVPTMIEQGLPGYELYAWTGVYLPAKAPPAIVQRLNQLVAAAVQADPKFFAVTGAEQFTASPQEFARFQDAEIALWARIVKTAGIEPE